MNDAELLQLIKRNDPRGLTLVYETFRSEFIQWIIKFTHCNREQAREYYQSAIMIVYDNVRRGKLEMLQSSLKTYLFGVGKNLFWQQQRQDLRNQKLGAEFYLQNHLQAETPEAAMSKENNLELISQSFNKLGEPCHSLLDLYYYQKKTMEEIAQHLQYKNTDTAKNQKYKCMERLRKLVDDEIIKQTVE